MGKTKTLSEPPRGVTFEDIWVMFQESKKEFDREKKEREREEKKREREEKERELKYEREKKERELEYEREKKERELEYEREKKEREREKKERELEREREKKERELEREQKKKEEEQHRKERELEIKKLEKEHNDTLKAIGYLDSRFGELAEHLVAPSIKEKFNEMGLGIEYVSQNHEIYKEGRCLAEIDLMLENGEIVVVVEVKSKPVHKDVDKHVRRMEILRQCAAAKNDKRKYQGAMAGAIMTKEVRAYIHKTGFYAIEQTGDTVRINVPKGFKAREW